MDWQLTFTQSALLILYTLGGVTFFYSSRKADLREKESRMPITLIASVLWPVVIFIGGILIFLFDIEVPGFRYESKK